ncbi:MAG: thiolase C-terminal domain-containing protein [Desulfobaccales bacterium]
MRDVAVIGIGMHPWGKFPKKTFTELAAVAIRNALKDAGLEWKDIQSGVCGLWQWGGSEGITPGARLAETLGARGMPFTNVAQACATGTVAFREAYFQVASGAYDIVIAVGCDISPPGFFSTPGKEDPTRYNMIDTDYVRWRMIGLVNPACWALDCRKRMEKYGTTESTLAKAKVAASKHGSLNPNALYKKVFTIEQVFNSPMVCDPLRLFMICPTCDGAAAAILCNLDNARKYTSKPIKVAAVSLGTPIYGDTTLRLGLASALAKPEGPRLSESVSSSRQAYEMSGVGPKDIDFLELPDNSSWHYLEYLEALGFCEPGEADRLLEDGETLIGGKIPVCPSGGLSSFGEAVSAHGLLQIYELVTQLRGEAGDRQVNGARVGMAQTYGAKGNSASVIMKR